MTDAKRNSVAEGKGPEDKAQAPRAPARPGEQSIEEDYGYVFFPKRNPVASTPQKSFWAKNFEMFSLGPYLHRRCLKNVVRCVEEDPFVRLMVAALKSRGWWVSSQFLLSVCFEKKLGNFTKERQFATSGWSKQVSLSIYHLKKQQCIVFSIFRAKWKSFRFNL